MKRIIITLVVVSVVLGLASCSKRSLSASSGPEASSGTISVSVTFNALAEITRSIGGPFVSVNTIIPDGSEPHDFEPKAKDLVALGNASVFVYNGLGLEYWVPDALAAAGNKTLIVVDASDGIDPISIDNASTGKETAGESRGGIDPHCWLSLTCAKKQTANIAKALETADPAHKDVYAKNAAVFTAELDALLSDYQKKFALVPSKVFVTGHAAFAYLCRDFGLAQNSVEDVFASSEPNAQSLVSLVLFCKKNNVKTIFVEEMVSPAVSQTLANEVGAKVETIYTLESKEDGKSYIDRMKSNLDKILGSLSR